jgi:hypothetical protein
MRIAWFRASPPDVANPLDDTAALVDALRSTHAVDVVLERDAHDFVWREARHPSDLCVYELDSTAACRFEWGYLRNYAGVVLLRNTDARDTSAAASGVDGRLDEYMSAFQVDRLAAGVASLRVPLLASRSVVVQSAELGRSLQSRYPEARVRCAPLGVRSVVPPTREPRRNEGPLVVGSLGTERRALVERAVERVRATGHAIDLRTDGMAADIVATSDVIVVVSWPPQDVSLAAVVAAMAAGKPVITNEMEATAEWPALDPQTWKPRGQIEGRAPIAVTVEPLDDEHSVVRALTRLASDARLCEELGRAAHAWWLANATPALAAAAWHRILEEASALSPPRKPADWPRHLDADGMEMTRTVLDEHGLDTDI